MSEKKKTDKKQETKKFIDKQGRVFGVISIIDVVVILAVIVVCAGVYLKNNVLVTTSGNRDNATISMTFEIRIIEEYVADSLQVGDAVFDKDHGTGGVIGYITDIEYTDAWNIRELVTGELAAVTSEEEVNVLVTLEGTGSYIDGHYAFNRVYELGLNAARVFQTKYATVTGFVTDIHIVD